ncbi:MAG: 3-deoxy-D-manno-octulosonic acid transferase [Flaviramulus sp.]|nr:glycosyltransferase N-terminal domain-containing protein [Flaviramulus sp.]NNC51165.1 3-deoxy-D-manno-octulosonic acid transferase [Flaviramulus sp.]
MNLIYNIAINFIQFALKCCALFNEKLKKGVVGRKNTFTLLRQNLSENDKSIWFHCASLGEYEQGLPVFKELRNHYKDHKIVLSFFSPSGYIIRENSPIADVVVYLPIDTKLNAGKFLDIVNPELTIFVKYDLWPNYLLEFKKRNLKAILISALFRKNQPYFKFYGSIFKSALFAFEHIFTQDENSKKLLESINYYKVTVSGDTRFDRVSDQLEIDNSLDYIEKFKNNKLCIVAGSTWPEDDALLINFINSEASANVKFIIAPHNIKSSQIKNIQDNIVGETVLFSKKEGNQLPLARVFIIDAIGILSKIYSYSDIAYVGGAVGNTGLHNSLEPAVFGVPIIIGNNYEKFPEAKIMIENGGMFSINNQQEFNIILKELIENKEKRLNAGSENRLFIKKNKGSVIQILKYLRI